MPRDGAEKRVSLDLVPLTSARLVSAKQAVWEWQCDHEDDAGVQMPTMQESREQLRTPFKEEDEFEEVWAASLGAENEVPTGPLAFVEAIWFQSIVGFVIAMNAIIIGIETDVPSQHWSRIENALLVFFVCELTLRICHHGVGSFLRSFGNLFDILIVCAGVFDMWLVPVVHMVVGDGNSRRSALMSVLQMLRLLRIIRLIRLVKIVQPVVASADYEGPRAQTVCSGGCSLAALQVPVDQVRVMFQTVPSSMFVLFESMSCWSLMRFTPLFERIPMLKLAGVMFYIFAAWALLAVMTGVVSEKMIAAREKMNFEAQDRENQRSDMALEAIQNVFHRADTDGSGEISREEFNTMLMWTDITKQLMEHSTINAQDLNELFEWLDHDKDGVVSIDEFMVGFRWLNDSISPKSFLKLQEEAAADIRALEKKLVDFANERFDSLISAVQHPLRKIHAVTEQIQRLDVQLSTRGGVAGRGASAETLDGINEEIQARGPMTRLALEELEERLSSRLDKLMKMVDRLDAMQAQGLVRLAPR